MGFRLCSLSDKAPEKPWATFCAAPAMPSIKPITLPLAFRVSVRKTGRIG
jgi:hypothetical protein